MLHGMCTVSYLADYVAAAGRWYAQVLGYDPYFVRPAPPQPPAYVEFRVGAHEDELGIMDRRYAPPPQGDRRPAGAILYWHVHDVESALDRLLGLGATLHEPVKKRGEGFVTASVVDPFGNILGVMYNAHYASADRPAATPSGPLLRDDPDQGR